MRAYARKGSNLDHNRSGVTFGFYLTFTKRLGEIFEVLGVS